jgi:hypothetical protein
MTTFLLLSTFVFFQLRPFSSLNNRADDLHKYSFDSHLGKELNAADYEGWLD